MCDRKSFIYGKTSCSYSVRRIYERVVEAPYMDIPEDASFWLGQRNAAHGFFKVSGAVLMPPPHHISAFLDVR